MQYLLPLAHGIVPVKEVAERLHETRAYVRRIDAKFRNLVRAMVESDKELREVVEEIVGRELQ